MSTSPYTLSDCAIEPGGKKVRLRMLDSEGGELAVSLSLDQLGSLAMTLPTLLERALREQFRDDALRYVYSLGSWNVESAADPAVIILSLATVDGFKASFGVSRTIAAELASALEEPRTESADAMCRPN